MCYDNDCLHEMPECRNQKCAFPVVADPAITFRRKPWNKLVYDGESCWLLAVCLLWPNFPESHDIVNRLVSCMRCDQGRFCSRICLLNQGIRSQPEVQITEHTRFEVASDFARIYACLFARYIHFPGKRWGRRVGTMSGLMLNKLFRLSSSSNLTYL